MAYSSTGQSEAAAPPSPPSTAPAAPTANTAAGGGTGSEMGDAAKNMNAESPTEGDRVADEIETPTQQEAQQPPVTAAEAGGKLDGLAFNLSGELVPQTAAPTEGAGTPNYYDWKELFPELKLLIRAFAEIATECADVGGWKAWPEQHYGEGGGQDWKVFPFAHTFPAYDESRQTWVDSTCARCPTTSSLLRRVPNIRTALFSRLGGGSRISGHRGWADLANHVLRCHLPLKVPSDGPCGLWVNGEVRHHVEGEVIVFDDSKLHKAFNESTGERLVLIVDILRPAHVPLGTADGEHTPELDAFIDAFR